MKNALIVVDAWCYFDESKDLWANKEAKAFGHFLNAVCHYERSKGTQVLHESSGFDTMNEIFISNKDTILSDIKNIEKNFDFYFFAGFHLDICVSGKADQLSNSIDNRKIGIVLNLSLLSIEKSNIQSTLANIPHNFYWWTREGFSPLRLHNI